MPPVVVNPIIKWITYPNIMPNRYGISEYGNVVDIYHGHVLQPFINTYGYLQIRLLNTSGTISLPSIARLVAYEFCIENRDIDLEVDHIDNNKLNNHYTNLEWVTNAENVRRSYLRGFNCKSTKSLQVIDTICNLLASTDFPFNKICELAGLDLNKNQAKGLCSDIIHRKYWKDISVKYNFGNRTNKFYKTTEEESIKIKELLSHHTVSEVYELLYHKSWSETDIKEKDRFRHRMRKYS